ncbi:Slc47a1 [Symbiodinium sp. CCMP2592]|nr:Slc47a1 [Symbiodinium sp. CCMP2592]
MGTFLSFWQWWDWSWNGHGWSENGDGWENGKQAGDWSGDAQNAPHKEKGEKVTAVQAAFGNLKWGPPFQDDDLFPEEPIRRVLDEGIVWEERWISPLAVRFSQGKIHPFFHERGPISEVKICSR